jgi:hypothetical protein
MNWRCYLGSRYRWLEVLWPMFGHLVRFRGYGEVYCDRSGCTWTDLY